MSRYLCDARVFAVPSFTQGGEDRKGRGEDRKVYRVVLPTDPGVPSSCTCPANTFKPGVDCKHIRDIVFTFEDDGFPELLPAPNEPQTYQPDMSALAEAFEAGFKAGARGFVRFNASA
jgi:hypothetical protein